MSKKKYKRYKLRLSHRKAISKAQQERHKKLREETNKVVKYKRCSSCGKYKSIDKFYLEKRKLKSEVALRIRPSCKKCERVRSAETRERYKEEGTLKERRDAAGKRFREKHAKKAREQSRARNLTYRRKNGSQPRMARRDSEKSGAGNKLPIKPLKDFFTKEMEGKNGQVEGYSLMIFGNKQALSALINGTGTSWYDTVTEAKVDRILTEYGTPHMLAELYPELYDEET